MKMQKCFNGHYYNTAQFSICPFCNKQNQPTAPPPQVNSMPSAPSKDLEGNGHSIFINPIETNQHLQELEREFHQADMTSPPSFMSAPPQPKSALANEIKGRTIYVEPPQPEPIHPHMEFSPHSEPDVESEGTHKPIFSTPPVKPPVVPQPVPTASGEKTKILYGDVEPVVGWLICLKGAYVGESFPLKTGQNFIGRSIQMDVPLLDEESVSRDTHAYIIFEPKKAEFYASNGTGNSLTYLNKELLMQPTRLKTYDILCFGECEYLFMPLCSEQFSWDAYLKK